MKKEEYFKSDKYYQNILNLSKNGINKIKENTIKRKSEYYLNPKKCLCCNKPIDYEYKNKRKFCDSSCAASYNNKFHKRNENSKKKTSETLKLYFKEKMGEAIRKCDFCNIEFVVDRGPNRLSRTKFCSVDCRNKSASKKLSDAVRINIEKGIHKGWQSRKTISFPEKFFKKVLDNNNIRYEFNKKVSQKSLGIDTNYNYFLDFFLLDSNVDLEIDGKQHELKVEHDDIRNKALINNGIKVYRIKWKNISTPSGKEYIKNEINKLLEFLNGPVIATPSKR